MRLRNLTLAEARGLGVIALKMLQASPFKASFKNEKLHCAMSPNNTLQTKTHGTR